MTHDGVAARFWHKVEERRVKLDWAKERISTETAKYTPDGKVIPRSTLDNLRTSTRAPQPRIVHAIADAVGLNRGEAEVLAGLLPPARAAGAMSTRDTVLTDPFWDDRERGALLAVIDALTAAKRPDRRRRTPRSSGNARTS